jgi:hypothetical protein
MRDKQMARRRPVPKRADGFFFSSLQPLEEPFTTPRLAYFSCFA